MIARLPILPTLLVGLAVAAMIGLGLWQLDRREWKEALIARFEANLERPPITFPRPPMGEEYLYRQAHAFCLEPVGWRRRGGRSATGTSGYRFIAECRTGGAEGPLLLVEVGVTADPVFEPQWQGGEISGTIVPAPVERSAFASIFSTPGPTLLMLVADTPAPGLEASARPDPAGVPNNHLAYAVQWFAFAAIALVIYILALRRRRERSPGRDDSATPGT